MNCARCGRDNVRVFNWLRRLLCADCIVATNGTKYPK